MHYYDIQTSETEELWDRWVGIEKHNRNFSLLIRSIIQNSGRLPEEYLNDWREETKQNFSRLKAELSQKAIDEIKELIKETYQYILSKKVEITESASDCLKVVVAGGREFKDYPLLKKSLLYLFEDREPCQIEIVSGGARGADSLGERFAKEFGCKLTVMPAEWDLYGKSAGYRRNAGMAKYSDVCVCFWDKVSKGTKHMIDLANREGLELKVVNY